MVDPNGWHLLSPMNLFLKSLARYSCALLVASLAATPAIASNEETWLPLKSGQIRDLLAREFDLASIQLRTVDQYLRTRPVGERSDPMPPAGLEGNETAAILIDEKLPISVVIAGIGDSVHTIRVTLPTVNNSEEANDRALRVLGVLFKAIYPTWTEAGTWPKTSLETAWKMSPFVRKEPLENPDDVIIRRRMEGITSATFGVPPDIAVYTITVRERCVPTLARGDLFGHWIC